MNKEEDIRRNPSITGTPHKGTFERGCYCVRNHGDGTGTIVLDWYEMSDGRDYSCSLAYMRTSVDTARQVVALLNAELPSRALSAPTEVDWSGQGAEQDE